MAKSNSQKYLKDLRNLKTAMVEEIFVVKRFLQDKPDLGIYGVNLTYVAFGDTQRGLQCNRKSDSKEFQEIKAKLDKITTLLLEIEELNITSDEIPSNR